MYVVVSLLFCLPLLTKHIIAIGELFSFAFDAVEDVLEDSLSHTQVSKSEMAPNKESFVQFYCKLSACYQLHAHLRGLSSHPLSGLPSLFQLLFLPLHCLNAGSDKVPVLCCTSLVST